MREVFKHDKWNIKQLFEHPMPTGGRLTSWLFTSVAEDLITGLPSLKQIQVVREEDLNPGPLDYKSTAL